MEQMILMWANRSITSKEVWFPWRNPIEQVVQKQSVQSVRAALSTLPRTERDVLRSTYYEELSHKEIANQLDIPLGTVKSRSRQALRKMRDALVEQERA